MILATDMARSTEDLQMFQNMIESNNVKDGVNADTLIDRSTPLKEFNSQQLLLEHTIHSGDMSVATRQFKTVK